MTSSYGTVGAIKETAITVDLDKTVDLLYKLALFDPFQPGQEYQWGVLLVELNPYWRLQYLGGGHRFRFERSIGGSGIPADPSATPRTTSTPRE